MERSTKIAMDGMKTAMEGTVKTAMDGMKSTVKTTMDGFRGIVVLLVWVFAFTAVLFFISLCVIAHLFTSRWR